MANTIIARTPIFDPSVLTKNVQLSYAFQEAIQNSISACNPNIALIEMQIIENGNEMIVRHLDNGHSITKDQVPDIMDIGVHKNKSKYNQNGVGFKEYLFLNNPSGDKWAIYCKNAANEMFKVHGPYMHYIIEDITEWPFDEKYNYVLETNVDLPHAQEFYKHLTPTYIELSFYHADKSGWLFTTKFNNQPLITQRIRNIRLDDNPYINCVNNRKKTYKVGKGTFTVNAHLYQVGVNEPTNKGKRTLKPQDIYPLDPDTPLLNIPDITTQSYINLCAQKNGNLAKNQQSSGIYLSENQRHNGRYIVDKQRKLSSTGTFHNSYNGLILTIDVQTENASFPSNNTKRGLLKQAENYETLQNIIVNDFFPMMEEYAKIKQHKSKAEQLKIMAENWCAEIAGFANIKYKAEQPLYDDGKGLTIDACLINENEDYISIRELKTDVCNDTNAGQICQYYSQYLRNLENKYGFDAIANNEVRIPNIVIICKKRILDKAYDYIKNTWWNNLIKRAYPKATCNLIVLTYEDLEDAIPSIYINETLQ